VERSPRTISNLALLGDKQLLFSENGDACIMYGIQGQSWISMGDPIGPQKEWKNLILNFRTLSDRHDGWSVFYEVDRDQVHCYLDQGFTLLKLGEEARVPLETFNLDGASRKVFRHTINKLEKDGYPFEILPAEKVPELLPELKLVSDDWLRHKSTREKGFSLGYFDEAYLCNFPVGIVRKENRILAFVNVWTGAGKEEVSVDLMRYVEDAPNGVMDYIFLKMMLWGKAEGYRWFNLGMAPFSGFEKNRFAPPWAKVGSFLFRYGEHFYNFQGLRQYKEKYDPVWESRYLATPGGLALPRILASLASLISGGMKGVIAK
jgi:phosphatidylglycerol lysyltransferase